MMKFKDRLRGKSSQAVMQIELFNSPLCRVKNVGNQRFLSTPETHSVSKRFGKRVGCATSLPKPTKKSQAAIEFMLTYGWAIVIVVVALSALFYFGVWDIDKFLPRQCVFPAGLHCKDFAIYSTGNAEQDGISFFIKNSRGKTIIIKSIKIDKYDCLQDMPLEKYGIIGNGESLIFPVYNCYFSGEKTIVSDITFTFLDSDTGLEYTETGSMRGNALTEQFPLYVYDNIYTGDEKLCGRADYFDFCDELIWLTDTPLDPPADPLGCCDYGLCC